MFVFVSSVIVISVIIISEFLNVSVKNQGLETKV